MALDDQELLDLVQRNIDAADDFDTDIIQERKDSLDYYSGEPFGNEVAGRSKVVTRDVLETVEWILPQVIEMFQASDNVVEFTPNTEEDVPQAEQETDYTRYVFDQQNPGFLILYQWIKDALIQKNGIVKTFWDENVEEEQETYENLDDDEFLKILDDDEVEIKEHTKRINDREVDTRLESAESGNPEDQIQALFALQQDPQSVQHDVVLIRKSDVSQVSILNIAPENFKVSNGWNTVDLTDVPFCSHEEIKTRGTLIEEGFDEATVMTIPETENTDKFNEENNRNEGTPTTQVATPNPKDIEVDVIESYIRVEEDGKQVLLRVIAGGRDNAVLLDRGRADGIPFTAFTPIIMPHKFSGMAIADIVRDIQLIRSTLMRQSLDSLYLANNPRYAVKDGMVNLDDVLTSRPGAPIRVTGDINTSIQPFNTPFVGQASFPMFELLDQMLTKRTGVSESTQGLSPESLKDVGVGNVERLMTLSQQRILLIARVFGETGYAPMMKRIHMLVNKYEKNDKIAELRGKYVSVSPRDWRKRRNMTVKVGTGNSTKEARIAALNEVIQLQANGIQLQGGVEGPIVTLEGIHNAIADKTKLSGLTADRYFSNPSDTPPQQPEPPQPDPSLIIAEANAAEVQARNQREAARLTIEQNKLEFDKQKAQQDSLDKKADRESKTAIELEKIAQDDRDNVSDNIIKREKIESDRQIDLLKIQQSSVPSVKESPPAINVTLDASGLTDELSKNQEGIVKELSNNAVIASNAAQQQSQAMIQVADGVKDVAQNVASVAEDVADATKELSNVSNKISVNNRKKKIKIKRDSKGNITGAESE